MPKFYFDVREGLNHITDDEGFELANLEAAQQKAIVSAADIAADVLPRKVASTVTVEVRDETGKALAAATVSLAVDRS